MLTYEQALQRILKAASPPRAHVVPLREALDHVLAKPLIARSDLPRFDQSAVDGYAVRSRDLLPRRLIGRAEAGRPFRGRIRRGETVRILTGAPVPAGADAVVMQEHAILQRGHLRIARRLRAGGHIRRRGEDVRRGSRVLSAGAVLRPQEIGLLAAVGHDTVPVYQRPTVAILVTGNEIRPPASLLKPGEIYESNGAMLSALVQQNGARVLRLGQARDTMGPLMAKIRRGLACDLLLIAGGVSVGDKDFVRQAAGQCGIAPIFWRVNIKPGMPLFLGRRGRTLVFGLPGNPVSVFVTFEEFVKPALSRLMGRAWRDGYHLPAILADDLSVSPTRRTHFIRVRCTHHNGHAVVAPVKRQGSHQLSSLVDAEGWIRMESDKSPWPVGTRVHVKEASWA